jgi:hypothetical protein
MIRSLSVRPLQSDWPTRSYDLAIATVGYEQRARYAFQTLRPTAPIKIACGFEAQQVFEYRQNCEWFESDGYRTAHKSDKDYRQWLKGALSELSPDAQRTNVIVDISSVTRVRLAHLLVTLRDTVAGPLVVNFIYSLAAFTPPPAEVQANSHVGPVTSEFAGWWDEPDRSVAAVVGLGYEQDKALGAVEHLQSAEIWTFTPTSEVRDYSPAVYEANRTLLESVPPAHQLGYFVQDPFDCFTKLESLVYGISRTKNPVLIPFGPKIFSLCSMLVGLLHIGAPVWRVSAEGQEPPVNRKASGFVYGLEVNFAGK